MILPQLYSSPTKHSRLDMLSNVKNQIEGIGGWLGSSIPKLRKNEAEHEATEEHQPLGEEGDTPASAESVKGSPQQKDDDDNSRFVKFLVDENFGSGFK